MGLIVTAAAADTSEYWVRPHGERYGVRDGRSYPDAFSGFAPLTRRRLDGKTVWVCGTHRETLIIDDSDVTVRLDCPDDPGTIVGSELLTPDQWSAADERGHHVFTMPARPKLVTVDDVIYPERPLGELGPGFFAVAGDAGSRSFKLHLLEDLRERRVEVGQREFGIQVGADQRSKVRGLTVLGGGVGWIRNVGAGTAEYPQGKGIGALYDNWPRENYGGAWLIDGVGFAAIQTQAIHVHGTSIPEQITVRNCRILDIGGEGIYVKSVPGKVLIENNRIGTRDPSNFGWAGDGGAFSGDGIDLGGSDQDAAREVEVRDNQVSNVRGSGIIVHAARAVIENNVVEDAYFVGASEEKGCFRIDPVYDAADITLERNRCRNSRGHGIIVRGKLHGRASIRIGANVVELGNGENGYAAALHSSLNARGIAYRNNTFKGGQYGLLVANPGADLAEFEFSGNIVDAALQPISLAPPRAQGTVVISGNLLHPEAGAREAIWVAKRGVGAVDGAALSIEMRGNVVQDPKLGADLVPTASLRMPDSAPSAWPESDVSGRRFPAARHPGAFLH